VRLFEMNIHRVQQRREKKINRVPKYGEKVEHMKSFIINHLK